MSSFPSRVAIVLSLAAATAGACTSEEPSTVDAFTQDASTQDASALNDASELVDDPPAIRGPREAGVVARRGDRLFIADEDRSVLRVVPLPLHDASDGVVAQVAVALPGRPAAVLALPDRVLVTVRDPGLLISFAIGEDGKATELGRAAVADDAWGLAVTPDGRTALVTSSWTQTVTSVDLDTMTTRWSRGVRREPRGVVILPDGDTAYVTHLSGAALTRIDDVSGTATARRVDFPAAPVRIPDDEYASSRRDAATLAYAAALSPDGERLFVPRHALGAVGRMTWAGEPTVDVLLTADAQPLATPLDGPAVLSRMSIPLDRRDDEVQGTGPLTSRHLFSQPRAVVYRERTDTLLVVSEGRDSVVELDALAIDPSASHHHLYALSPWDSHTVDLPAVSDTDCGAPSGLALSEDEARAFVFCRSTATLAEVVLSEPHAPEPAVRSFDVVVLPKPDDAVTLHDVADDPLDDGAAFGRRLFYDGRDTSMSFGMACAACHPDGRDDGHVWHEVPDFAGAIYRAFPDRDARLGLHRAGEPRQTPMLAGRVDAEGPYGWRGKDDSLMHRVLHGFSLHHTWGGSMIGSYDRARAAALVAFLREGLVPPAEPTAPLTAEQERGRAIFDDPMTGCATCHVDDGGEHTDRTIHELDLRGAPGFLGRESARLRTPSLRFLAGTAPYLHDGSVATLDELIGDNHDRMGRTTRLTNEDRGALVAFLKSLGGGQANDETLPAVPRLAENTETTAVLRSVPPAEAAWAEAAPMALTRAPDTCNAFRLDDWVRIRCAHHVTEVAQFGGSTEGVILAHGEPYVRQPTRAQPHPVRVDDAVLTFPIQVGDRRQFQLLDGRPVRWSGVILSTELVVSELWLEDDPEPQIVIH